MTDLAIRTASLPAARAAARPRARRVLIGAAVCSVVTANAGVIVGLWVDGGGVSAVHTAGDLFTSLGRVTGLLGAYLVTRFANGARAFDRAQDVFKFAGLAALLSTTASATAGIIGR